MLEKKKRPEIKADTVIALWQILHELIYSMALEERRKYEEWREKEMLQVLVQTASDGEDLLTKKEKEQIKRERQRK